MRVTQSPAEVFSLVVDVTRGVFLGLILTLLGVTLALLILG